MLSWIVNNLGSILVLAVLLLTVGLVLAFHLRRKRQGKSSCGCGCASCPMADKCHPKEDENKAGGKKPTP